MFCFADLREEVSKMYGRVIDKTKLKLLSPKWLCICSGKIKLQKLILYYILIYFTLFLIFSLQFSGSGGKLNKEWYNFEFLVERPKKQVGGPIKPTLIKHVALTLSLLTTHVSL